jgi:hypothetical protein
MWNAPIAQEEDGWGVIKDMEAPPGAFGCSGCSSNARCSDASREENTRHGLDNFG